MAMAQLNLRVVPRRMLSLSEAAGYVGLPAKRLRADCPVSPVELPGGSFRYDMKELDAWLDSLKDGAASDDALLERL